MRQTQDITSKRHPFAVRFDLPANLPNTAYNPDNNTPSDNNNQKRSDNILRKLTGGTSNFYERRGLSELCLIISIDAETQELEYGILFRNGVFVYDEPSKSVVLYSIENYQITRHSILIQTKLSNENFNPPDDDKLSDIIKDACTKPYDSLLAFFREFCGSLGIHGPVFNRDEEYPSINLTIEGLINKLTRENIFTFGEKKFITHAQLDNYVAAGFDSYVATYRKRFSNDEVFTFKVYDRIFWLKFNATEKLSGHHLLKQLTLNENRNHIARTYYDEAFIQNDKNNSGRNLITIKFIHNNKNYNWTTTREHLNSFAPSFFNYVASQESFSSSADRNHDNNANLTVNINNAPFATDEEAAQEAAFQALYLYFQTGCLFITPDTVADLLTLSEFYQCQFVHNASNEFLWGELTLENFSSILSLVHTKGTQEALTYCIAYILQRINDFMGADINPLLEFRDNQEIRYFLMKNALTSENATTFLKWCFDAGNEMLSPEDYIAFRNTNLMIFSQFIKPLRLESIAIQLFTIAKRYEHKYLEEEDKRLARCPEVFESFMEADDNGEACKSINLDEIRHLSSPALDNFLVDCPFSTPQDSRTLIKDPGFFKNPRYSSEDIQLNNCDEDSLKKYFEYQAMFLNARSRSRQSLLHIAKVLANKIGTTSSRKSDESLRDTLKCADTIGNDDADSTSDFSAIELIGLLADAFNKANSVLPAHSSTLFSKKPAPRIDHTGSIREQLLENISEYTKNNHDSDNNEEDSYEDEADGSSEFVW